MKVTPKGMNFSIMKIGEMSTWQFFIGWSAVTCSRCRSTANVPIGSGWFCPCDHYNIMDWNHHQIPHTNPGYGPSQKKIQNGYMWAKLTKNV